MKHFEILTQAQSFAVIGLNPDPEKYANKIYTLLKKENKDVYGVNINYSQVDNDTVYPSILDVPAAVDVAVMVVNPTVGLTMIDDIHAKGVKTLWLQPGTRSPEISTKAKALGLEVVEDCVLAQYEIHNK